jgi:mRNA interferase MazF
VLTAAGRGDWVLCQVTSKAYGEIRAIKLEDASFASGSPNVTSYACPDKLFTANRDLILTEVARLKADSFTLVMDTVVHLIQSGRSQ